MTESVQHIERISLLPKVLCLQIKRFEIQGGRCAKLKDPVKYSTRLELPFGNAAQSYSLVSLVEHTGDANKGHYTCYARDN
jgi:ubiquitin C-terminal hydrolase